MNCLRKLATATLLVALHLVPAVTTVFAQSVYPSKPVRVVVPYPPGGAADITGREVARKLGEAWGQQVVVDNRAGAAAAIGHGIVAKAPPDGYTLVLGTSGGLVTTPALGVKLPYDPVRDFAPIGLVVHAPWVLTTHSGIPADNVKDLVEFARASTKKLNFGSPGTGTPNHLGGVLLMALTGIQMVHVPYRGGAPAMTDLIGGQIDAYFASFGSIGPHLKSGRVRAIAVGHPTRLRAWRGVPTIAETYPGFDNSGWYAVLAPAGTPRAIVQKINTDLNKAFRAEDVAKRMDIIGMEVASTTPAELSEIMRSQLERWSKVIKDAGITLESAQ